MERLIASHHHAGHRLDVVERVDDGTTAIRLLIDGEVLLPDGEFDSAPTADEAARIIDSRLRRPHTATTTSARLTSEEVAALLEALDDEHKAQATYAQVLEDFGDVLPFANIVEAEGRHIGALTTLLRRYGIPVPPNPWYGRAPRFTSVTEACHAGVQAEIENANLYHRLIAAVDRPDVLAVFRRLKRASEERHLPAFRRCAERGERRSGRDRVRHPHRDGQT